MITVPKYNSWLFCLGLFAFMDGSVSAQERYSLADDSIVVRPGSNVWIHNGSAVYSEWEGQVRKFVYLKPSLNMQAIVKPDTVLAYTTVNGNEYSGTAFVFSSKCGPLGYNVQGTGNEMHVELNGSAPVRDAACKVVKVRDDKLIFDFVFRTGPSATSSPSGATPPSNLKSSILSDPYHAVDFIQKPSEAEIAASIVDIIHFDQGLDLSTCFYNGGFLNDERVAENQYLGFYFLIVDHTNMVAGQLAALGYPKEVWSGQLLALRNEMIKIIGQNKSSNPWDGQKFGYSILHSESLQLENQLVGTLAKYRSAKAPHLLPVHNKESCGGDFWGSFHVQLKPADGKLWLINEFNSRWCGKHGYDLVTQCDFWVRILPSLTLPFGTYKYRIEWADGSKEIDTISVDDGRDDGKTFTLRKTK